jgi:hypothetical protein
VELAPLVPRKCGGLDRGLVFIAFEVAVAFGFGFAEAALFVLTPR